MTIGIAIFGAGQIGRRHVELVATSPSCNLVAICDPAPAAAQLADQHGVPCFQRHEDLLRHVEVDGAIIATPNALHVPVGIACAQRGIDLLVEKPIADTVGEASRLVDVAEAAGVKLVVGHHRRFNPLVQRTREVVQNGKIGRLAAVNVLWTLQKPDAYYAVKWRTALGGGPLLINLIHDIDTLRYVCGEIEQIYALTSSATRGFDVEDTAAISFQMAGGAIGSITVSDATPAPWSYESNTFENPAYASQAENCYYFLGSQGSLAFPRLELWRYADPQRSGWNYPLTKTTLRLEPSDPLTAQLAHFCRVIRREENPLVTGSEGVKTLAVTLAARESARLGRAVLIHE